MSEVSTCCLEYFDNILSWRQSSALVLLLGRKFIGLLAMVRMSSVYLGTNDAVCIQNRDSMVQYTL